MKEIRMTRTTPNMTELTKIAVKFANRCFGTRALDFGPPSK